MSDDETADVRPDEVMDWDTVAAYLRGRVDGAEGPMRVRQFPGGSANLTYLITFDAPDGPHEFVLRRPPLGPVAPGAHDMAREHKVLSRLYAPYPRAPRSYHLCTDESVIGAKFIVVERRTGVVIRDRFPDAMLEHPRLAERATYALVDAMAELHNVEPAAHGLADLGKPDGFAQRQVDGWASRWELAKDKDVPLVYEIHRRLNASVPKPSRVSILHNDLKFDNCQYQTHDPDRVTSIFDWDMATLGDPLFDLGTLLGYWSETTDPAPRGQRPTGAGDPFPTRAQITRRYAETTGIDMRHVNWYEAFALWKTTVVVQQIYIRFARGQTKDARFARIAERQPILLEAAARLDF
ncbi:MAG TPA: phosphotransferase family protein [Pseudomonadales bacterium]|nr:phosphotransferase family protein [Pseudomonadales bacterium]